MRSASALSLVSFPVLPCLAPTCGFLLSASRQLPQEGRARLLSVFALALARCSCVLPCPPPSSLLVLLGRILRIWIQLYGTCRRRAGRPRSGFCSRSHSRSRFRSCVLPCHGPPPPLYLFCTAVFSEFGFSVMAPTQEGGAPPLGQTRAATFWCHDLGSDDTDFA